MKANVGYVASLLTDKPEARQAWLDKADLRHKIEQEGTKTGAFAPKLEKIPKPE